LNDLRSKTCVNLDRLNANNRVYSINACYTSCCLHSKTHENIEIRRRVVDMANFTFKKTSRRRVNNQKRVSSCRDDVRLYLARWSELIYCATFPLVYFGIYPRTIWVFKVKSIE
jgi:hypothetical protein